MPPLLKLLLIAFALSASLPAGAEGIPEPRQEAFGTPGERILLVQSDGPTLSEAVERVRRQYDGRIVSAETRVRGKREVHHIKVLTQDGKVKTVRIPGRSRGA